MALSMAEFASIWPTAGGQYHWTAAMAPLKPRKVFGWFACWIVTWMTIVGSVSATFSCALQVQSYIAIARESYVLERWHTYMMYLVVQLIGVTVNILAPRALHHISIVASTFHILGLLAVMITLLATTRNKNSAKHVFATLDNQSGWDNDGVSFFIGLLPAIFGFLGIDIPSHYSEETADPRMDVPRAMVWGIAVNAVVLIPFSIVLGFCMGPTPELLASPIARINPMAQVR